MKKKTKPKKPNQSKSTGLEKKPKTILPTPAKRSKPAAKKKAPAKKKKRARVENPLPPKRPDLRAERLAKFIVLLSQTGNVAHAARLAKVDYSAIYKYKKTNSDFNLVFEEALDIGTDLAEGELFRRAVQGWDEKVFGPKGYSGLVHKYSDTLLIFLLKGRRRKTYGDTLKHQGDPDNPLFINADNLTRDELLAEIAATSERLGLAGLLAKTASPGTDASAVDAVCEQPARTGDKQ